MISAVNKFPTNVAISFQHESFTWHNFYPVLIWIGAGLLFLLIGTAGAKASGGAWGCLALTIGAILFVGGIVLGILRRARGKESPL
ncbi:MAG: hypothetical protein ACRDPY_39660 [Streptosporangiaceae bacterium]